jgi:hypothetical protein
MSLATCLFNCLLPTHILGVLFDFLKNKIGDLISEVKCITVLFYSPLSEFRRSSVVSSQEWYLIGHGLNSEIVFLILSVQSNLLFLGS